MHRMVFVLPPLNVICHNAGVEEDMQDDLPPNEFYENFGPDYQLQIKSIPGMENKNKKEAIEKVRVRSDRGHFPQEGWEDKARRGGEKRRRKRHENTMN